MSRPIHRRGTYTCSPLFAYDAVTFLPKVMELFPEDEINFLISEEGRQTAKKDPNLLLFLSHKDGISDEGFIDSIFHYSDLKNYWEPIDMDTQFENLEDLYDVLSWVTDVTYGRALAREWIEIPDIIKNAGKLIKQVYKKDEDGDAPQILANGVNPPNMNPWMFSVIASINKQERIDWNLLRAFKTELFFDDFIEIWECVESVKTYEAAELINSL